MLEVMCKMLDTFQKHVTKEKEVGRFIKLEKDIKEQFLNSLVME